jgi:antitoxin component YwqK of YwqJK toxin-antitoxin module
MLYFLPRIVCLLVLVLPVRLCGVGQIADNPNVTTLKGKQGLWTEYLDRLYQPVLNKAHATIIRVLRYRDGVPVDTLKDYDTEGHLLRCGKATSGTYDEVLYSGIVRTFYPNGAVDEEEHWDDEKKNGPYRRYYPSRRLRVQGQYADGLRTGQWIVYFDSVRSAQRTADGTPIEKSRGSYFFGVKEGLWTSASTIGGSIDSTWYIEGAPVDGRGFLKLAQKAAFEKHPDLALQFMARMEQLLPDAMIAGTASYAYAEAVRATIAHMRSLSREATEHVDNMMSTIESRAFTDPDLHANVDESYESEWKELKFTYGLRRLTIGQYLRSNEAPIVIGERTMHRLARKMLDRSLETKQADTIYASLKRFRELQLRYRTTDNPDPSLLNACGLVDLACQIQAARLQAEFEAQCTIRTILLLWIETHTTVHDRQILLCYDAVRFALDSGASCDDELQLRIIDATEKWNFPATLGNAKLYSLRMTTLSHMGRYREVIDRTQERLRERTPRDPAYLNWSLLQILTAHMKEHECQGLETVFASVRLVSGLDLYEHITRNDLLTFLRECGYTKPVQPRKQKSER